ncbi:MAG: O-antigen ligase family protein [Ignavibacteria bacterium]
MQHYNMLGMGQATIIPDFMSKLGRASGMSEMELELSYILSVVIIVLLGIYLRKGLEVINRNWLFIPLIVLAGGLYYSYTRSSIFAVACGLVSILLFILLRSKWWIILAIVFVVFVFLENSNVVAGKGVSGRDSMEQLESSISREILWQAGLAIAEDHPILGIGVDQFIKVSPQYTARVDPALIQWETNRYWSYRTLGNEPPHNDYMMMWVSYGIIALVLFIWLHFVIFNNFMKAYFLSTDKFTKGISLGFAAALVTYVVNSFYHNMLATMPLFWVLAGFSLVTMKLAKKEKKLQPVPELMTEISTKQA